ncbi:MAG: zinc finger domain-containing protein, partial [Rhodospirillales bacterium]
FLCFKAEEAWQARQAEPDAADSVHRRQFPEIPDSWNDEALENKWRFVRNVRRVVTGALELERANKTIRSSLEAHVDVYLQTFDESKFSDLNFPEIFITSSAQMISDISPAGAFTLDGQSGIAVVVRPANGEKCERCWKKLEDIGSDADHPTVCGRCADAVRHSPLAAE